MLAALPINSTLSAHNVFTRISMSSGRSQACYQVHVHLLKCVYMLVQYIAGELRLHACNHFNALNYNYVALLHNTKVNGQLMKLIEHIIK